ncbi:MAG: DUF3887 domain-containing protein [Pelosinus sp.]|nr:DUF3887 domain-containing protein [Pelosinus sp.]
MRFLKQWATMLGILLLLINLLGCSTEKISPDETKKFADPMTENILIAMNEDNYSQFSKDFDKDMKNKLNEAAYQSTIPAIKAKIGNYISKELIDSEKKDGFIIVTYKAKFSKETSDVIIRSVFSKNNEKIYISGFWVDSPKLRNN